MQRIVATFLLLLALGANITAIAQVTSAVPAHACCRRNAAHHCHESGSSESTNVHGTGCCNHDCCRAATTSQWAYPLPSAVPAASLVLAAELSAANLPKAGCVPAASKSTRGPPVC